MQDVVKENVRRTQSSKRQRRRKRRHRAYFALVILLVFGIGLALSMTLFFNVTDIVVNNETDASDEEIVTLSGIRYKDNLVRLDAKTAAQRITAGIAYAENVRVDKKYPSTIEITVEKAKPVANISQSYGYLLVSGSNRVLEELKGDPRPDLIVITGYNPAQGTIGMYLQSEDEKRDNVLKTLTAAVEECNNREIKSIDMTDQSDIIVQFGTNIVFRMGTSVDAVYKLRLAAKTIEQLNPDKRYLLTMIGNNQISVIMQETVREPQQDETDEPALIPVQ
ncbi:MAG: FtsQ-type POTRA domain-containing protein [Oscillospiraceae bacterium]|nr:FtsQ-type POTRA domain-containing protein [Oscillospiraceae bacterium]